MTQGACAAPRGVTLDPDSALDTTYGPYTGGSRHTPMISQLCGSLGSTGLRPRFFSPGSRRPRARVPSVMWAWDFLLCGVFTAVSRPLLSYCSSLCDLRLFVSKRMFLPLTTIPVFPLAVITYLPLSLLAPTLPARSSTLRTRPPPRSPRLHLAGAGASLWSDGRLCAYARAALASACAGSTSSVISKNLIAASRAPACVVAACRCPAVSRPLLPYSSSLCGL